MKRSFSQKHEKISKRIYHKNILKRQHYFKKGQKKETTKGLMSFVQNTIISPQFFFI